MKRWVACLLAAPAIAHAEPRHVDWFALDLDVGGGIVTPDREGVFLGRVRTGYVRVRDDLLSSIAIAVETKDFAATSLGIGIDAVWLRNGLGGNAGVMATTEGDPVLELGIGWLGLRLEGQVQLSDPAAFAALAFVRIPLGAIAYKLWGE